MSAGERKQLTTYPFSGIARARKWSENRSVNPYGMQAPPPPFYCRACAYQGHAMIVQKVSAAGWVVFALLLLFCLPLFWIGLLIKDNRTQCPNCKVLV